MQQLADTAAGGCELTTHIEHMVWRNFCGSALPDGGCERGVFPELGLHRLGFLGWLQIGAIG